jgi:hypothetical protein
MPIYPDDAILKRIMGGNLNKKLQHEDGTFNLKSAFISEKMR